MRMERRKDSMKRSRRRSSTTTTTALSCFAVAATIFVLSDSSTDSTKDPTLLRRSLQSKTGPFGADTSTAVTASTSTPITSKKLREQSAATLAKYQIAHSYDTSTIITTQKRYKRNRRNSLLMFDGTDNTFKAYSDAMSFVGARQNFPIYLLSDALRRAYPNRFTYGMPTFQLLFSVEDYPITDCLLGEDVCDNEKDAPILHFGSTPKNKKLLPTTQSMPLVTFTPCLAEWRFSRKLGNQCHLPQTEESPYSNIAWDDLKPTIVWRGTDWNFLHHFDLKAVRAVDILGSRSDHFHDAKDVVDGLREVYDVLTPRWRAVTLSLEAKMPSGQRYIDEGIEDPWIDAEFTINTSIESGKVYRPFEEAGAPVATDEFLSEEKHAHYKYHLDLGGGGGTTWTGTLTKLLLPGVLFHHETLTKDWFYDQMEPWKHYIPIKMDLSDLKEQYEWAEAHPEKCRQISQRATELALRIGSDEYLEQTYKDLMGNYLSNVVDAYDADGGESVKDILAKYEKEGIHMKEHAKCDEEMCGWNDGGSKRFVGLKKILRPQ